MKGGEGESWIWWLDFGISRCLKEPVDVIIISIFPLNCANSFLIALVFLFEVEFWGVLAMLQEFAM